MFNANLLFYSFSILLVFNAFMVIISKSPIFSLLFLVASFIFSSFLLFLLKCEFLALIFITIYVGAIAVLFLFAVMMLESKHVNLSRNAIKYFPIGFIFGGILYFFFFDKIISFFGSNFSYNYSNNFYLNKFQNWYDLTDSTNDIEVLGQILYSSSFVLNVLVAGLVLLAVLIGVVYLTSNYKKEKTINEQAIFKQLARKSNFLK
jgi:NADH-quinone oxidoreductase subunit J